MNPSALLINDNYVEKEHNYAQVELNFRMNFFLCNVVGSKEKK